MGLNSQSSQFADHGDNRQNAIIHYELDFQQNGNKHYYVWRHHSPDDVDRPRAGLLVDLGGMYVPDPEIEKMVFGFLVPRAGVIAIAFVCCHAYNQQEIKRKLKANDIKLYSKTAFFAESGQARQWLEGQCANA